MSSELFAMGTYVRTLRQRIGEQPLPKLVKSELLKINSESIARALLVLDDEHGILNSDSVAIKMLELCAQQRELLAAVWIIDLITKNRPK